MNLEARIKELQGLKINVTEKLEEVRIQLGQLQSDLIGINHRINEIERLKREENGSDKDTRKGNAESGGSEDIPLA